MSLKLSRKEIQQRRNFTADNFYFDVSFVSDYDNEYCHCHCHCSLNGAWRCWGPADEADDYTKKNQNQNQTGLKDIKPREKLSKTSFYHNCL